MADAPAALDAALAAAQGEFEPVKFDKEAKIPTKSGREIRFKYASHGAIIKATQPALTKYGIALNHTMRDGKLYTSLRGYGEVIESEMPMPSEIGDWKTFGGAITYAKRYARAAILDVAADEDVDAALADEGAPPRRQTRRTTQPPPPPPTISDYEAMELANTLTAAGADITRFCAHFGIAAVKDLPKARWAEANEMLSAKIAHRAQVTQAQENPELPPTVGSAPPPEQQQPASQAPNPNLEDDAPWEVAGWVRSALAWITQTSDRQAVETWWQDAGEHYQRVADLVSGMDDETRHSFDQLTEALLTRGLI